MHKKTSKMNITAQELCQLLREHLDLPVYNNDMLKNGTIPFIVVKKDLNNKNQEEEVQINIYVPNRVRTFGDLIDNSYPDTETLDVLEKDIQTIYQEFIEPYKHSKLHVRKYIKEGNLHYVNLYIVFNNLNR